MAVNNRYGVLSVKDIDQLNKEIDNKNTQRVVKKHVEHFRAYLASNGHDAQFENHSLVELCGELNFFFCNVRTQQGEYYKLNTLNQMHFAVKKYLSQHDVDIGCKEFTTFNESMKMMRKKLAKSGKAKVDHKDPICRDDLIRLYSPGKHIV